MRLLKVVLTAVLALLALVAGLLLTAVVAVGSIVLLGARRLFRGNGPISAPTAPATPARRAPQGEIIDVTATEVRADAPRIERAAFD